MNSKRGGRGRGRKRARDDDEPEESIPKTDNTSSNVAGEFDEELYEDKGTLIIDDIRLPAAPAAPPTAGDQFGERLLIETIDVYNFKSYGGHCKLGPFFKSFNSIVGPNGSGKSNVIDAIVFIFGFRASKIRTNKVSSLIHKSETRPNCDKAQVTVNFVMINDTGDNQMNYIEGSRFSISRTVLKNNTNFYQIGERRVPFKEVSEKLSKFGIDLRYNRFLILQGEVEQISLMKPKAPENAPNATGMLEYLEDIIGTSRYKKPLDQLDERIEEKNTEVTNLVSRAKLTFKELARACNDKNDAIHALKKENELKTKRAQILMYDLHGLTNKLTRIEGEYSELEAVLNKHNDEESALEAERSKLDAESNGKGKEYEALKKAQTDAKKTLDDLSAKDYYIHQKTTELSKKLKKLTKSIDEQRRKLEQFLEISSADDSNEEMIKEIEDNRTKLEQEAKEIEEAIKVETEAAQSDCLEMMAERDKLDKECVRLKKEQTDKLNRMNEAKNVVLVSTRTRDTVKGKLDSIRAKMTTVHNETIEKQNFIERLHTEIPTETQKLKRLKREVVVEESRYDQVSNELNLYQAELENIKRSKNKSRSHDHTKNQLIEANRLGHIHGLHGQLRDLGAIDSKYDVAITTACGRLYNYVIDTIDNAQKAVEYMKQNNLAAVTFIALDKMRPNYPKHVDNPEGVPRLFDLVRIKDEKFNSVFYYALGDTVVANDLDQASRIGYGANPIRTVTLNGEMVETSGMMSGGGKPRSGGMSNTIQVDEVDSSQIEELELKVSQLRGVPEQILTKIESLKREIDTSENDLKTMTENLQKFEVAVSENQNRLKEFEISEKLAEQEWTKLEANPELAEAQKAYDSAERIFAVEMAKFNEKQDAKDEINKQINLKLNEKLEPAKKKQKVIEKKLKEVQTQLDKILADKKAAELNRKQLEVSLEAAEKARKEALAEQEEFKTQRQELEAQTKELNDNYLASTERCSQFEGEFNANKKQLSKINERLKEIKNERIDFKHEAELKFKIVAEARARVKHVQKDLNEIKLEPLKDLLNEDSFPMDPNELVITVMTLGEKNGQAPEIGDAVRYCEERIRQLTAQSQARGLSSQATTSSTQTTPKKQQKGGGDQGKAMEVENEGIEAQRNGDLGQAMEVENEEIEDQRGEGESAVIDQTKVPPLTDEELLNFKRDVAERKLHQLEVEFKKLALNFTAIEEYRAKRRDYYAKFHDLEKAACNKEVYVQLNKKLWEDRKSEFRCGFLAITRRLKKIYQLLTDGGDADLEYRNTMDPYESGINFAVRPKNKSWKINTNLSGGEKTLASLALIFALHYYKPSPLYIMDEIDAALDFKNVSIVATYIQLYKKNTQFLIISLRNNMYELSYRLIGIYKTYNITKSIAFDPFGFDEQLYGPRPPLSQVNPAIVS